MPLGQARRSDGRRRRGPVGRPRPAPRARSPAASCSADGLTGLVSRACDRVGPRSRIADRGRGRAPASARDAARGGSRIALGQLDAVELGHEQVEERDVELLAGLAPSARASRGDAGVARRHLPAAELGDEDAPVRGVVVDDEHACSRRRSGRPAPARAARSRRRRRRRWTARWNVAPSPATPLLSASSEPSISSASRRLIARPRPRAAVARERSTRRPG